MFCGDDQGLFFGCGDEGASGEVIGSSEESPRALMDGGKGCGVEVVFLNPCDGQMVSEVVLHVLVTNSLQVAAGYDTRGKGQRGTVGEFIDEEGLTGEDDGQIGFGISFKLGEGMKFLKDIETEQGGLIDEQSHLHLFA